MRVEQIYTKCLAEAAYYIESNGEAVVIDPLRETAPYLERSKQGNAKIKYVLETHFHADFVSGHLDLAKKTGAQIVFGPTATAAFDFKSARDGEFLTFGNAKIKVLHTPGHTMESTCFLLIDEQGNETALFTGDTLFIGDVGRPDLALKSNLSKEDLAGLLFDSLRTKIVPLDDRITIYPAHGAGSACGKNMSKETFDTLGNQKLTNYALRQDISKDAFIKELLEGMLPAPQYFPKNALMNKSADNKSFDTILADGVRPLNLKEFQVVVDSGALILDVRHQNDFCKGFIPNAWFIGIDGGFAPWVGNLVSDINQKIVLVCPEGRADEVVKRLARVGYDNTVGFLQGGFSTWKEAGLTVDTIAQESAEDFEKAFVDGIDVLDVRKPGEYSAEHVEDVNHIPLDYVFNHLDKVDSNKTYHVHCAGGYRSVIFISILKAKGFTNLIDIVGGYGAIKRTNVPKTDFVCSSQIKER
jgi:hydroxyacylglutathione hydrolase